MARASCRWLTACALLLSRSTKNSPKCGVGILSIFSLLLVKIFELSVDDFNISCLLVYYVETDSILFVYTYLIVVMSPFVSSESFEILFINLFNFFKVFSIAELFKNHKSLPLNL